MRSGNGRLNLGRTSKSRHRHERQKSHEKHAEATRSWRLLCLALFGIAGRAGCPGYPHAQRRREDGLLRRIQRRNQAARKGTRRSRQHRPWMGKRDAGRKDQSDWIGPPLPVLGVSPDLLARIRKSVDQKLLPRDLESGASGPYAERFSAGNPADDKLNRHDTMTKTPEDTETEKEGGGCPAATCSAIGCPHSASGQMPRPGICKYHQHWLAIDPLPAQWPQPWPGKPSPQTLGGWGRGELVAHYWPNAPAMASADTQTPTKETTL